MARVLPLLLVLTACPKPAATGTREEPEAPVRTGATPDAHLATDMRDHFLAAIQAQDAVILGDLAAARLAVAPLRALVGPQTPGSWRGHLHEVEAAASAVAGASSLPDAAEGVARLGAACGDCHRAHGSGPTIDPVSPPVFTDGQQMSRHQWAADRLWLGLTGPSDEAWTTAATVLAEAPLVAETVVEAEARARFAGVEAALQGLGKRAATAEPRERAALYAEALQQCSVCHAVHREDPVAPGQ